MNHQAPGWICKGESLANTLLADGEESSMWRAMDVNGRETSMESRDPAGWWTYMESVYGEYGRDKGAFRLYLFNYLV